MLTNDELKISGRLGASMVFYDVEGRETTRSPFTWMLVGNPVISYRGITLPFSMTISEQNSSFRQPFNKIGASPYYKWAKFHLGYRNPVFSKYTLGGHTILGAGGEFNPGNFRVGIMYGRLLKPLDSNPLQLFQPGTYATTSYKRNGLALKLGYGTSTNYVDFLFFNGWDMPNSITQESQLTLKPAENAVISIISEQKIKEHITFGLEYAASTYTDNSLLDDLPGLPDSPDTEVAFFSGIMKTNISSRRSNALDTYFGYSQDWFGLKLRLKQIDPGYRSMGTWYMQNDYRNLTIEPRLQFHENKYVLSSSLGLQRDNLKNPESPRMNRTIGSISLSANPVQWYKADLLYSNYDLNQINESYGIDSLLSLSQTTQSLGVNQNISLAGENFTQNLFVSLNRQLLRDKNPTIAEFTNYTSNILLASYMVNYLPRQMSLTLSYNHTSFNLSTLETRVSGPVVAYSASFLKNALNLSVSNAFYTTILNGEDSSKINIFRINSSYRFNKKHLAKAGFFLNNNTNIQNTGTSIVEKKAELGYSYIF
ncbi:MAG: hypothetical protein P1P82_10380 [Bacteroidales bacterium]|nr:hypothetical protein [Bacteroidales bacterium]